MEPFHRSYTTSYWSAIAIIALCYTIFDLVKAAFHYSSQLQTCFSTRFAARFSTSSCGFATCFRLFRRKPGCEPQQVRWFVHVLDKWNLEKTRFKQVRSWLSTCLRPGFRPGLQLARITECCLYCDSKI